MGIFCENFGEFWIKRSGHTVTCKFKKTQNIFTQVVSRWIQVGLDVVEHLQDVDGFLDADAGVQNVVLAVVGSEQLVDCRGPDGNDQVYQLGTGQMI